MFMAWIDIDNNLYNFCKEVSKEISAFNSNVYHGLYNEFARTSEYGKFDYCISKVVKIFNAEYKLKWDSDRNVISNFDVKSGDRLLFSAVFK